MSKTPEMENVLSNITKKLFGRSREECYSNGTCVTCGGYALSFRDPASKKEYDISVMCQGCQDEVYNAMQ